MLHLTVNGLRRTLPDGTATIGAPAGDGDGAPAGDGDGAPAGDGDGAPAGDGGHPTILDALRRLNLEVPTLCQDDRIAPQGACRVCLVELEGHANPVAACTTPAEEGMAIVTQSPALNDLRRTVLGLLAEGYPPDALAADPDQPFHQLLRSYGLDGVPVSGPRRREAGPTDDSHPLIDIDMDRCIACFRCVRICEEVQGQFAWRIAGRGPETRVVANSPTGLLADSPCVSCGACVDTCPTGALADRPRPGHTAGTVTRWTRTTCPYCGVGCELQVGTRDGDVIEVRPAHDAPVNRGHLCVKGRYGHGFIGSPERLTTPLVRDAAGVLQPVTWPEAVRVIAGRLSAVVATHGPAAVGVLGSARATNEENYVAQKFARAVLGTNNVDCCARVCHAPSAMGLSEVLGTGAATSSYDDIERARTIVVCGTNTTENHPIVGARIKQAALRGAHLVVIDPRRTELAQLADIHLRPLPGSNVSVLNALASVVVGEGLVDQDFVSQRVEGLDAYARWVQSYQTGLVAEDCGLDPDDISAAARLLAGGPTVFFHGLGLTEQAQGTEAVMCLVNLALLTGNVGRPGTGVNPLRGQNNVQGAAHMGCEPRKLTGYVPVDEARQQFADVWGVAPPELTGLDAMQMIDAAGRGELHALWVVGWDLLLTQPDTNTTRRALDNIDFLVVQDIFLDETARDLAAVVLPAAGVFEKDGTFMNSERRVQRVRQATRPPGEAKPDWEPFQLVAAAMGWGHLLAYGSAEEIWEEVRMVWPAGRGMTYERLARPGGLQWPCPDTGHPGTTLLHTTSFPRIGTRARLREIDDRHAAEPTDADHPFVLVTGRGLYQFNAGTMTNRTPIRQLRPTDLLEIAPADAAHLGVGDGEPVRVVSRYGEATLPAWVTERVASGTVFATFSDPAVALNHVIGPQVDPMTHTPEYKVTAVNLARA